MINRIKNSNGFTLIELMIAIAIFAAVIAGIITSKTRQLDQGITQQQAVEMQQSARAIIYLMTTELRAAGFNPHFQDYDAGITNAGASTLTFTKVASDDGNDNNGDGTIDEDGEFETITYALQDNDADLDMDITFDNGAGPRMIAENILNLSFAYFDGNGAVTAALDDIRSVQISVTATTDIAELAHAAAINRTRTLSTMVYLRNLGF